MSYPGTYGSVIYLKSCLSTMFEISDVMIDKDEVAMVLNIKIDLPEEMMDSSEASVSKAKNSVSNLFVELILQKVGKSLAPNEFFQVRAHSRRIAVMVKTDRNNVGDTEWIRFYHFLHNVIRCRR